MGQEKKSIEQIIAESDLINTLREELGEGGEKAARAFLGMSKEDRLRTTICVGMKVALEIDFTDMILLHITLKGIQRHAPEEYDVLTAILFNGLEGLKNKIARERREGK